MLPSSNACQQNVKRRHRNGVTDKAKEELEEVGGQRNNNCNWTRCREKSKKGKHSGAHCIRQSDFFSNSDSPSDSDDYEVYMTHRRQRFSESSDESSINDCGDCREHRKISSFKCGAMMRQSDSQRHSSVSQISNATDDNQRCNRSRAFNQFIEVAIRIILIVSFIQMERVTPFKRIIHPEEAWLYKNPISKEYVPASVIITAVICGPLVLIIGSYLLSRDKKDFTQANYAFTLAIGLNGFVTSLIKISVGRPRPDFYYRCYPDGAQRNNFDQCTGDPLLVNEGRKSFPSGHSSMAFAAFGFMSFYLASKLHIFSDRGRGHTWRLCTSIAPLIVAAEVAISRTCDYRHHWQDVVCGSLIGICISYLCYRQYFPSIFARNSHRSFPRSTRITTNQVDCFVPPNEIEDTDENQPLIAGEKDNKWI